MMKTHVLTWIFFLGFGFGCATLRPDPNSSAMDSHYSTAEFWAGGKLFHGLGEVRLNKGQLYSDVSLKVQGYYSGVIRFDSEKCKLEDSVMYENSALVPVLIDGAADESCVIDIVVAAELPGEEKSDLQTYPFKGQLLIKVLDKDFEWYGVSTQIKKGSDASLKIPFSGIGDGAKTSFFGCGISYKEQWKKADAGLVTVSLSELLPNLQIDNCPFEGFSAGGGKFLRLSWNVWGYAEDFVPLPSPFIDTKHDKVYVKGDDTVSVLSLDDEYVIAQEVSFDFDRSQKHILRAFTVKGRSALCKWEPGEEVWKCQ